LLEDEDEDDVGEERESLEVQIAGVRT